jgi:hypothetical protein
VSDLTDLKDSLKREVAIPGAFASAFPATTDSDLEGSLMDAFWAANLDGWFPGVVIDDNGLSTPDMSRTAQQLVVIYAAVTILRVQIQNLASSKRYKAASVEFDTSTLASVLVARLNGLEKRITELIQRVGSGSSTPVFSMDGYSMRASELYAYEVSSDLTFGIGGSFGLGDNGLYGTPGDPGRY